jgi:hypothetical protein
MEQPTKRSFETYISELREERHIDQVRLCQGLCSISENSKMESMLRNPGKLVQDRILERLGVDPTDFENLLYKKDYDRWKRRQQIQRSLREEKWEQTEWQLDRYQKEFDLKNPLEQQYVLGIRADLQKNTMGEEGLADLYEQAIHKTLPEYGIENPDWQDLTQYPLSVYELNLILEYGMCHGHEIGEKIAYQILAYLNQEDVDEESKVKLYPKVVCFLWNQYRSRMNTEEQTEKENRCREHMSLCETALGLLQKTSRLYYMWELLRMRLEILEIIDPSQKKTEIRSETCQWKDVLEELYRMLDVPLEMRDSGYILEQNEVYCVGNVVQMRRKMLGLSIKELCEGICDMKTLRRLEQNSTKTQRGTLEAILYRLNLPINQCRTEIQTTSHESRRLMRALRNATNTKNIPEMKTLMQQVEGKIPMENSINRQVMGRYHLLYDIYLGQISGADYQSRLIEILEMTIPLEVALAKGPKYMTSEELLCLQNLIKSGERNERLEKRCVLALRDFYSEWEAEDMIGGYIGMYSTTMRAVTSYQGDCGEYEESNRICKRIIRESLLCRQSKMINSSMYCVLWNQTQQKKGIAYDNKDDTRKELLKCIAMGELAGNEHEVSFYRRKLSSM